jgi:hypothetical protein
LRNGAMVNISSSASLTTPLMLAARKAYRSAFYP